MRTCVGFGGLLALILTSPGVARAEEDTFFQNILGDVANAVHVLRPDVTVSVAGLQQGRLQQVRLHRWDANGRLLVTLQAGEVEVLRLDVRRLRLLLRIRDGKFAYDDTTGRFEERVLWVPLFPRR